ncbi:MAG: hypothetical protein JNN17_03455 [Verrucomicrobiaceae bacterium]|nr:hypothetical protein [Verrucomicrobiaceae bacterium]
MNPPSLRAFLLLGTSLALSVFITSCAMTGDPMEDTIFFSRQMADQRLAQKRYELGQEQRATEAEQIRSRTLNQQISSERAAKQKNDSDAADLRSKIGLAEAELAKAEQDVADAESQGGVDRAAIKRRDDLQAEVNRLTKILHRLLSIE